MAQYRKEQGQFVISPAGAGQRQGKISNTDQRVASSRASVGKAAQKIKFKNIQNGTHKPQLARGFLSLRAIVTFFRLSTFSPGGYTDSHLRLDSLSHEPKATSLENVWRNTRMIVPILNASGARYACAKYSVPFNQLLAIHRAGRRELEFVPEDKVAYFVLVPSGRKPAISIALSGRVPRRWSREMSDVAAQARAATAHIFNKKPMASTRKRSGWNTKFAITCLPPCRCRPRPLMSLPYRLI